MTPLKSIEEEKKDCIAAFKACPEAKFAWCCHHEIHVEFLTESFQKRINYIISDKPESERALRFRNFRPVRVKLSEIIEKALADYYKAWDVYIKARADWNKTWADYEKALRENKEELIKLHNEDWPDNSWNGKSIFK